jgi:hypothetical protein
MLAVYGEAAMKRKPWSDRDLLWALFARDAGWSCKQIGRQLRRSANSVIGAMNKTARDLAASEKNPDDALIPPQSCGSDAGKEGET